VAARVLGIVMQGFIALFRVAKWRVLACTLVLALAGAGVVARVLYFECAMLVLVAGLVLTQVSAPEIETLWATNTDEAWRADRRLRIASLVVFIVVATTSMFIATAVLGVDTGFAWAAMSFAEVPVIGIAVLLAVFSSVKISMGRAQQRAALQQFRNRR
jgi:hypothetical protein